MHITKETVSQTARLARIALSAEEEHSYFVGLSTIIEYFDGLKDVPTDGVAATSQAVQLTNVTRPDTVLPSYPPEDMLANVQLHRDGYILTEPVLDADTNSNGDTIRESTKTR